jgi:hypothetical protein
MMHKVLCKAFCFPFIATDFVPPLSYATLALLLTRGDTSMPADPLPQRNYFATHEPILTWGRISWATSYAIQISRVADFTDNLWLDDTIPANQIEYQSPRLENGIYYWRVQARRNDGTWGGWSTTERFAISVP